MRGDSFSRRDEFIAAVERAGGGRWTGPGGHIEPGETAEEAVRRELAEEAGIEVTVTGLTGVYSKRDPAVVFVAYRGATDGEPVAGDETDEVRWSLPTRSRGASCSRTPWCRCETC